MFRFDRLTRAVNCTLRIPGFGQGHGHLTLSHAYELRQVANLVGELLSGVWLIGYADGARAINLHFVVAGLVRSWRLGFELLMEFWGA